MKMTDFPGDMATNQETRVDSPAIKNSDDVTPSFSHRASSLKKQPFITGEFFIRWPDHHRPSGVKRIYVRVHSTTLSSSPEKGKLSEEVRPRFSRNEEDFKVYEIKLYVEENFGIPGAFSIENRHNNKFFLVSATLTPIGSKDINFDCRSWVYPSPSKTKDYRVFFANTCYLPSKTPPALEELRTTELKRLTTFMNTEPEERERVYRYDCYDDLGILDWGRDHIRPTLGGKDLPYPRRIFTGHRPSKSDTSPENKQPRTIFDTYVPPDERMSLTKQSELISNIVKVTLHFIAPITNFTQSFESFGEILDLFAKRTEKEETEEQKRAAALSVDMQSQGILQKFGENIMKSIDKVSPLKLAGEAKDKIRECKTRKEVETSAKKLLRITIPIQDRKNITYSSLQARENFPRPQIIIENEKAWNEDKEFARQMLAGTNPTRIRCLKKDEEKWASTILKSRENYQGEVKADGTVFILDHHEYLMPFLLNRINSTGIQAYASRTILLREKDDTLKPIAIELRLPSSILNEDKARVFFPPTQAQERDQKYQKDRAFWQLAKAHVAANDCAYHQLISHWLHTHAVVEPFIIATRRCLSVMHPIHRLLDPHFKDTVHINALARRILLNSGGIFERILFTGKFSMELSSALYKEWRFDRQALPEDLKNRGMAEDSGEENEPGVKLIFDDYPYAADGLEIWVAIKRWVKGFCGVFYDNDEAVCQDEELKNWWREVRNEGHPDIKEGWYELDTRAHLHQALTTLIWITTGLHASVSLGQYAYAGYPPNRPTQCRKPIPEENSKELTELLKDPKRYLLDTLPKKFEAALGISLMYVLSYHTSDEVYLGRLTSDIWIDNNEILYHFGKFHQSLVKIEKDILTKNRGKLPTKDINNKNSGKLPDDQNEEDITINRGKLPDEQNEEDRFKNRWGPAKIPYKLLCPDISEIGSSKGVTGRGIPTSISM